MPLVKNSASGFGIAAIPGTVAAKQFEIEAATAAKLVELDGQEQDFLRDVLKNEIEPVLTDVYRRILGRDPSMGEINDAVVGATGRSPVPAIDVPALEAQLAASSEKAEREADKAQIISDVENFLNQYLAADDAGRDVLLQSLGLSLSATRYPLSANEVDAILNYLRPRSLHFGQSAFLSLREMLASRGVDVPMTTLGKEALLVDIFSGLINPITEGDLLLSMYALNKVAAIHGQDFSGAKFSYDDLLRTYNLQPTTKLIAHIGSDHFVVITNVTATEVTVFETSKGASGESVTYTKDQFEKIWYAQSPGLPLAQSGYLIVPTADSTPQQRLTEEATKQIRGSFFFLVLFVVSIALTIASAIVSQFSPTVGKWLGYAAMATGVIGIVASIGNVVVQGLKTVFSQIATQGLFQTIANGFQAAGNLLVQSVTYVGRFVQSAFTFIKQGFTQGLSALTQGITNIGKFLFTPAIAGTGGQAAKFSFAQTAARSLIGAGVGYGTSKGLGAMGLNPELANLAGAFIGGGVLGLGGGTVGFMKSGLQQFLLQGVSEVGLKLGIPPPAVSALSLVGSAGISAAFSGGSLTLNQALRDVAPQVTGQLAAGGIDFVTRSNGMNPYLAQLLRLGASATVSGITQGILNQNGTVIGYRRDGTPIVVTNPNGIFDYIKGQIFSPSTLGQAFVIGNNALANLIDVNPFLLGLGIRTFIGG
ncbi:MAG: hypothetical protein HZC17_02055, partial [Candidatus Omnitrophica bacterium]|nr:hypothetical protein [Candidatus Omnitrophota bacterium]